MGDCLHVYRFLLFVALTLVGCSREKDAAPSNGVVWRPEAIRVTVSRDGYPGTRRPYVQLDQTLPEGTEGWTMSKFELPADWAAATAAMDHGHVLVKVPDGEEFTIDATNFGDLGSALLQKGRNNQALRKEWRQHAGGRGR